MATSKEHMCKGAPIREKIWRSAKKNYQEGAMPEAKEISLTMKREWSACQIPQR